jgi:hypothetical protein
LGVELEHAAEQRTPRGGRHILCDYPKDRTIPNSTGRLGPGIDVRGEGGYIILAPSRRKDGRDYQWIVRPNGGLPPPPPLEFADPPRADPRPAARDVSSYGEKALAGELAKLAAAREGERNDTLNKAAFAMAQLIAGGHLDYAYVEARLKALAISIGLDPREVDRTLKSGFTAGFAEPRHPPDRPKFAKPERRHHVNGHARPPLEEPSGPAPPLPIVWFEDIRPTLATLDFVEGLLTRGAMSVVYGESNCGKTFFTADLALHVAWGQPWFGRAVDQGGVIYVACEGGFGMENRVAAFRQYHGLDDSVLPFGLIRSTVNLLDPYADTPRLIAALEHAKARVEVPVLLTVVDTLSRALAGGNENAPDDMGALVANADAIRQATGTHLLFVHHSGKDQARGARGHSLLRAATDTEIEIARDQIGTNIIASVTKQREMEVTDPQHFSLEVVELGQNARGKAVTSCVVIERQRSDAATSAERARVHLSDEHKLAFRELQELLARSEREPVSPEPGMTPVKAVTRDELRTWFITRGVIDAENPEGLTSTERSRFRRLLASMKAAGLIGIHEEWIWPTLRTF